MAKCNQLTPLSFKGLKLPLSEHHLLTALQPTGAAFIPVSCC